MRRITIRVSDELHEAIKETAASEQGESMNSLLVNLLEDVFGLSKTYVRVPITGVIVEDQLLGNKVIPFPVEPVGDLGQAVTTNGESEAA